MPKLVWRLVLAGAVTAAAISLPGQLPSPVQLPSALQLLPAPLQLEAAVRADATPQEATQQSLAPYVPTPQEVVDRMLELAEVGPDDVVYDLGCGDGRIPITAAVKYGARGVGIDIDPVRIAESKVNAAQAGVEHLTEFRVEDALEVDVSDATVVTLYLLSSSNLKLRPRLTRQLAPGSRIVSHAFSMGDWQADTVDSFVDSNGNTRTLYVWHTDGVVRP